MPSLPCACPECCDAHPTVTGPVGMRAAALLLPALAAVAGYALPASRRASAASRLVACSLPVGAAAMVLAARGPLGVPSADAARPAASRRAAAARAEEGRADAVPCGLDMVTVVVPARDEGAVVGRLIADLGAARSDPMRVLVVDDASCDGMTNVVCADIERSGLGDVASVVRLASPSGSKGGALATVAAPASGVVVVLDADARVGRDFIARVREAGRTAEAAQARRRMLRPADGGHPTVAARALALVQDGEQEADSLIARARLRVHGAAEFRGDGMVIRAEVLARLGGWPADALCEDLELATRWYLASGVGVQRPAGLEIWEQPVLAVRPLVAQRLRWAEGSVRRDLRLVLPALLDPQRPSRRRLELAAYASQALAPWVAVGMAARGWPRSRRPGRADGGGMPRVARQTLGGLVLGYASAAFVLAWGSQPRPAVETQPDAGAANAASRSCSSPTPRRRLRARGRAESRRLARAGAVTAFTGLWALVLPVAWLRVAARPGSPQFSRTPHEAPARFSEPGSDPMPPT